MWSVMCDVVCPVQRREVEDVRRRLGVLERQWGEGAISHPVQTEMSRLLRGKERGHTCPVTHSLPPQPCRMAALAQHTASMWP